MWIRAPQGRLAPGAPSERVSSGVPAGMGTPWPPGRRLLTPSGAPSEPFLRQLAALGCGAVWSHDRFNWAEGKRENILSPLYTKRTRALTVRFQPQDSLCSLKLEQARFPLRRGAHWPPANLLFVLRGRRGQERFSSWVEEYPGPRPPSCPSAGGLAPRPGGLRGAGLPAAAGVIVLPLSCFPGPEPPFLRPRVWDPAVSVWLC